MDPDANVSHYQFMLRISATDGLLNSYAKLDRKGIDIVNQIGNKAQAKVNAHCNRIPASMNSTPAAVLEARSL